MYDSSADKCSSNQKDIDGANYLRILQFNNEFFRFWPLAQKGQVGSSWSVEELEQDTVDWLTDKTTSSYELLQQDIDAEIYILLSRWKWWITHK